MSPGVAVLVPICTTHTMLMNDDRRSTCHPTHLTNPPSNPSYPLSHTSATCLQLPSIRCFLRPVRHASWAVIAEHHRNQPRHTRFAVVSSRQHHTRFAVVSSRQHHTRFAVVSSRQHHTRFAVVSSRQHHTRFAVVSSRQHHTRFAVVSSRQHHTRFAVVSSRQHHTSFAVVSSGSQFLQGSL